MAAIRTTTIRWADMVDFRLLDSRLPAAFGNTVPDILGEFVRGEEAVHQRKLRPLILQQQEQVVEANQRESDQLKALAAMRLASILKDLPEAERIRQMNLPEIRRPLVAAGYTPQEIDTIPLNDQESLNTMAGMWDQWQQGQSRSPFSFSEGGTYEDEAGNLFQETMRRDPRSGAVTSVLTNTDPNGTKEPVGKLKQRDTSGRTSEARVGERADIAAVEQDAETAGFEDRQEIRADTAADIAAESERGKGISQRQTDDIQFARDYAGGLGTLRRGLELLNLVETGGAEAAKIRAKQLFGVESADEGELASLLGVAVLQQLKPIFGSQFTEREGARLDGISARMGANTATNKRLLRKELDKATKSVQRGIDAAIAAKDFRTAAELQDALDAVGDDGVIRYDAEGNRL